MSVLRDPFTKGATSDTTRFIARRRVGGQVVLADAFMTRGHGANAAKGARADMRREAKVRIAAMEAAAKTEIERISVESQTELICDALTSEAAKAFLEQIPAAEALMPTLELNQVRGLLEERDR